MRIKYIITAIIFVLLANVISAQWAQVNTGLTNLNVTSMFAYEEVLIIGSMGGGVYKTTDSGNDWIDINGDLANKNVNNIHGGLGPDVVWVATDNGIFLTLDHVTYSNQNSGGLSNTNANYYWFGSGSGNSNDWAVGTEGSGVFISGELNGPWAQENSGLTGDALFINDISGFDDIGGGYVVIATNGGAFFSNDASMTNWVAGNGGLSGNKLKMNMVMALGSFVLVATDGGMLATLDSGVTWLDLIPDGKMNIIGVVNPGMPNIFYYAMGSGINISADLQNWVSDDMSGISGGNITAAAANSNYLFVSTETGGVFRKKIDLISDVNDERPELPNKFVLEQNFPNPFNPSTTIKYSIPAVKTRKALSVQLKIYDVLGHEVRTLVNEKQNPGNYQVLFDATGLPSGIYFYRISTGVFTQSKKLVLLK